MDEEDDIRAREPSEQLLRAGEVMMWLGLSEYLFYESVKRGQIKKINKFGKRAFYHKGQIKSDLGI